MNAPARSAEQERARGGIPPMAWVLSGAVAVALFVLAALVVSAHGSNAFFTTEADAYYYRLVARSPLGNVHAFAAVRRFTEAPYRYGRIGLPVLGWLFALGRPAWVSWSLIGVYIASIAAIPGIAAVLLDDLGAPPAAGAVVLLAPGLLLNYGHVYADPLVTALLLLACVLEGRGRRSGALVALGAAIFVKEIAVFALLVWIWQALRRRDLRGAVVAGATVVPYLVWCVWIRGRLGAFPFFAHTYSRKGALSLPFVGLKQALEAHTYNVGLVTGAFVVTVALGALGAWVARGTQVGALAFVYTLVTVCLGKNALAYLFENARVMAVTQVLAMLCIVVGVSAWNRRRTDSEMRPENHGLFVDNTYL